MAVSETRTHQASTASVDSVRIGDYLIERLLALGVTHAFGVPGDFVLGLFAMIEASPLTMVNTCDEQGAGFAADAYARVNGLGVVVVTYGVGGLKVANAAGQAYAEMSPVVFISGAPGRQERHDQPLLHHKVRFYETQLRVFDQLTVTSAVLDDRETACREIDRALNTALLHKRPVYIELPRDMVGVSVPRPTTIDRPVVPTTDPDALRAAVDETVGRLRAATRPVAFLGLEVGRFELLRPAMDLIERMNLPTAVTLLDKSAISEQHPLFLGVYAGAMSRPEVADYVEASDLVLLLGSLLTDVNLGGGPSRLDRARSIHFAEGRLTIGLHAYDDIRLADYLGAIAAADLPRFDITLPANVDNGATTWRPVPDAPITVARLFERLATFLTDDTIVIADPGDALLGALDLPVHRTYEFFANAYYASLGFAVPASIGAQLAAPGRRPLVLVGDGSFQMTGMELSTSVRFGLSPIVVILENGGYAVERLMVDGTFNDVLAWDHTTIPELFGSGVAFDVRTEDDLDLALAGVLERADDVVLIRVQLDPTDVSPAMRRFATGFAAAAVATAKN